MHQANTATQDNTAHVEAHPRHVAACDDMQVPCACKDRGYCGYQGDQGVIVDRNRQFIREHADEVHGPNSKAHDQRATRHPRVPTTGVLVLRDTVQQMDKSKPCQRRDEER